MQKYRYSTKPKHNKQNERIAVLSIALILCLFAMLGIVFIMHGENDNTVFDYTSAAEFGSDMLAMGANTEALEKSYIDKKISGMTLDEKIGQLFLLRTPGTQERFCTLIRDTKAGGVVIFAKEISQMDKEQVRQYLDALQSAGGGNLFVAVDEEGGTVVRVSSNKKLRSAKFLSPQNLYSLGGFEAISSDAAEKSELLLELGFNINFAPVADVVTEKSGFLYKRAFGKNAEQTAQYVSCVVSEMEQAGIGSSLKHFPGYGNSSGDTHKGLVYVDTSLQEIRNSYLVPFYAGINSGADSVMITHSVMTAIDPKTPASLSEKVVSLLRDEMGFNGVIITDGMDMGAVIDYGEDVGEDVCVLAIKAGCDLLCTPADPRASFEALKNAVLSGKIPEEQIDESLYRIIRWKIELGLI